MATNDDLFGLGAMWDAERENESLDEIREFARDERAAKFFWDALRDVAGGGAIDVWVTTLDRPIHVLRIGLDWIDGALCGSPEIALVPRSAITFVRTSRRCSCSYGIATALEFVSLGAVLRQFERQARHVTLTASHQSVSGRITGVWRDAVRLRGMVDQVLVPVLQIELVVSGMRGA
jgi:hypothetical protein